MAIYTSNSGIPLVPRRAAPSRPPTVDRRARGAAWRLFLFLWRGKKSARARPAPPKHAPRSDAARAERSEVPDSLSFATSHPAPKVTVQPRECWRRPPTTD